MSGQTKDSSFDRSGFERGGYRPLQGGYTPESERGYVPLTGNALPEPPAGGTGQSPPVASTESSPHSTAK